MLRTESLVIATSLLILLSAGVLWLLTAMGVHSPTSLLATAFLAIAVGINL